MFEEVQHAADRRDHQQKGPEGDAAAAVACRRPNRSRPGLSAPIRGPKKTYCSELTSGNWVLASSGKPAEKPMNEPKVPV